MILREFIKVTLLNNEHLRIAEDTTSISIQRRSEGLDQPEEWTTLWSGSRTSSALKCALDKLMKYQQAVNLELASSAMDYVA